MTIRTRAILSQLPLSLQTFDPDLDSDDRTQQTVNVIRRRIGYTPRRSELRLMGSRQLRHQLTKPFAVLVSANHAMSMYRNIIPRGDHTSVFLLGGIPGGRNVMLRPREDRKRHRTRIFPDRIGTRYMPFQCPEGTRIRSNQHRDVVCRQPAGPPRYERGQRTAADQFMEDGYPVFSKIRR